MCSKLDHVEVRVAANGFVARRVRDESRYAVINEKLHVFENFENLVSWLRLNLAMPEYCKGEKHE